MQPVLEGSVENYPIGVRSTSTIDMLMYYSIVDVIQHNDPMVEVDHVVMGLNFSIAYLT